MSPATMMQRLTASGLTIRADGERLIVSPRERLTEPDRAMIREHRAELVAFIHHAHQTTATLLELAMKVCDAWGDDEQAREAMKRDCLDTPLHLRQDLIEHFQSVTTSGGTQTRAATGMPPDGCTTSDAPTQLPHNGGCA